VRGDDFQVLFAQLSGPVDADVRPFFRSDGRFNFGGFSDERFDGWADTAVNATDRAEALDAARAMQQMLVERQVVTPLYYPATLVARRDRLRGIAPTWLTPFAAVDQWWVTDAPSP
jgi:ABC-type oligopeptide transport system substrate-binding subunit